MENENSYYVVKPNFSSVETWTTGIPYWYYPEEAKRGRKNLEAVSVKPTRTVRRGGPYFVLKVRFTHVVFLQIKYK